MTTLSERSRHQLSATFFAWIVATAVFFVAPVSQRADAQEAPTVTVDETVWLTFYDVPSRRFLESRRALFRGDLDAARADLIISAGHLQVEAGRTTPAVGEGLMAVSERLLWLADNIEDARATPQEFDTQFGRAHWLLAQHYLFEARLSRNRGNNALAGRYLWATTHHMERAVIWSNARIDRRLRKTLDDLRNLSTMLQDSQKAPSARRQRPIVKAEKILRELGETINRPVVLPAERD